MKTFKKFKLEPYWSRAHVGLRYGDCHVLLASSSNMEANIEFCNQIATWPAYSGLRVWFSRDFIRQSFFVKALTVPSHVC